MQTTHHISWQTTKAILKFQTFINYKRYLKNYYDQKSNRNTVLYQFQTLNFVQIILQTIYLCGFREGIFVKGTKLSKTKRENN